MVHVPVVRSASVRCHVSALDEFLAAPLFTDVIPQVSPPLGVPLVLIRSPAQWRGVLVFLVAELGCIRIALTGAPPAIFALL
jgi:hypothetical protein